MYGSYILAGVAASAAMLLYTYKLRPFPEIPHLKITNPILGHLPDMMDNSKLVDYFLNSFKICGPIFQLSFPGRNLIVISDPEIAKEILSDKPDVWKRSTNFSYAFKFLTHGLLTMDLDDPTWKKHRTMLSPAFMIQNLKFVHEVCINLSTPFIKTLNENKDKLNMHEHFSHIALDTIMQAGFTCQVSPEQNSELYHYIEVGAAGVASRVNGPRFLNYLPLKKKQRIQRGSTKSTKFCGRSCS